MKLKKIVSLALAGVLAVSMLAGCKGGESSSSSSSSEQTTTSNVANMLYSELTGSAKEKVTAVANADLDKALENAVDKYFDYDSDWGKGEYGNGWKPVWYDHFTDVRGDRVGKAVIDAMNADYNTIESFNANLTSDKVAVEVYAIDASTSDAYAMELLAEKIDGYLSNLPVAGGANGDGDAKANYDYDYEISASVTSRTVTFAGVETGVKYVAFMLTNTVTEKG